MTYDEAAARLGIKADSVRRRAAARKWPKRQGNDGKVRVGIPNDIIPDATPAPIPDITPDHPDAFGSIQIELASAQAKIEGLEARLSDTQAERDRLAALLEKALETRSIGLFARLFGR